MQKLCIENVLSVETLHDFDYTLGKIEYTASRRKKVVIFTFELNENVLFASTELTVDIEKIAQKIIKICQI